MTTAKFFIPGASTNVENFLESDSFYYFWSMVNTIHHNSDIEALGQVCGYYSIDYILTCSVKSKEKTSKSNAAAKNAKRKLSAVEEIEREMIGRRLDAICNDRPSLLRGVHVVGYNLNGTYTST